MGTDTTLFDGQFVMGGGKEVVEEDYASEYSPQAYGVHSGLYCAGPSS